jgi:fructose-1,6-bisphosphatase/inositol monophosphatase family enzyme
MNAYARPCFISSNLLNVIIKVIIMQKLNYSKEIDFASCLTKGVAELIQKNLQVGYNSELKDDGTHVTEIDKLINKQVINATRQEFPKDGILGEEESDMRHDDERLWVCDPLDGTFPFKCGLPMSLVLLGLVKEGKSVMGVAYSPFARQLFVAAQGTGAFVNGRKVRVNKSFTKLAGTPVGVSGPNPSPITNIVELQNAINKSGAKMQILGVTGYEHMMVGAGQYGGQIFGGLTRHDMVVGDIFVREAGGEVTDIHGNTPTFDASPQGLVLSNGIVHQEMLELIKPYILK